MFFESTGMQPAIFSFCHRFASYVLNPILDYKILALSKLTLYSIDTLFFTHQQQIAFENIAGKGEIARNEQFLLFPQCFVLNQIIVSL